MVRVVVLGACLVGCAEPTRAKPPVTPATAPAAKAPAAEAPAAKVPANSDAALREALGAAATFDPATFDPRPLVHAVNTLHAAGRPAALAAIAADLNAADKADPRQGLFLVLRLLFEVPPAPGHMPPMRIGASIPPPPANPAAFPRFPIVVVQDVPILLVTGYVLGGLAEPVSAHLATFSAPEWAWRTSPLRPPVAGSTPADQAKLIESIMGEFTARWTAAYGRAPTDLEVAAVRRQVLLAVTGKTHFPMAAPATED